MEQEFTYSQAVFGLMLLGAKADGKLQDEEKRLLVELTSEEHHLSPEEYRFVIVEAKQRDDDDFAESVYDTLNAQGEEKKVEAAYWLWRVIESDDTTNKEAEGNEKEQNVYREALSKLGITAEEVSNYAQTRN